MQNANYQNEPAELNDLLKSWQPPNIPASLDRRIMAAYRQHRMPFWKRFFTASIRIPVPLVAATALLLLAAGCVAWTALDRAAAQALPVIQAATKPEIIPVPVVQERVVTRTVYVEKTATPVRQPAPTPLTTTGGEMKLASHVAGGNAYTDVDLSGYQPVEEMKVRIIKGNAANEN